MYCTVKLYIIKNIRIVLNKLSRNQMFYSYYYLKGKLIRQSNQIVVLTCGGGFVKGDEGFAL